MNNPVKYNVPSGHLPTGENDDTPCLPSSNCYSKSNPPQTYPANYINTDLLSDETQKEIYNDYIGAWNDDKSWLWEVYGQDGMFSFSEFLAALMMGESENYWGKLDDINDLFESEVREYYDYANHFGLDYLSIYTLLAFVATEYQSVHGDIDLQSLYNNWVKNGYNNVNNTLTLMNFFRNPPGASWKTGISCWKCPYWTGNSSMFDNNLASLVVIRNNGQYVCWAQDGFLILQACVVELIRDNSLSNSTITSCPIIRGE